LRGGSLDDGVDRVSAAQRLDLTWLRLTREQLDELFAMGTELMRGKTVRDRVRPVALLGIPHRASQ
jgi:hypothetical protein